MIQTQFINYLLDSKDTAIISLNALNDSFFSDCKAEFNFIKDHVDKYGNIPDKETFLNTFMNFPILKVEESPEYLITALFSDRNERFLAKTFNDIRNLLVEDKIEDAMNLFTKASEDLPQSVSFKPVDILKDTSRYDDYIERTKDFEKYYISTGFPELDNIIGGWDRTEELAVIVGRTNTGKSWLVLKLIAAAVEQGLRVGLYSGEMSERKVGYRIDTLLGHVPNGSLIHGNADIKEEYKKYIDSLSSRYKGSLLVLTPKMINGPAGVASLKAFIQKEKLDILFIDQYSLLEDDRKAKNPVERASNISRDVKNLQVMEKIPIIAISQQNRTVNENGVDTTQIAQSDRIGQDATCAIFIERKDDLMKLTLVKSRDSENGKVLNYNINFNTGMFTYIPSENDSTSKELETRYSTSPESNEEVF